MPEEVLEIPQIVEPKQKNWPKIILATALGFGLLAGAAYAGYWYGTESAKPKTQTQPTPTPAPEQAWKILSYTDFSLQIPPEAAEISCDQSSCWSKSTQLPTGARFAIILGGEGTLFPNETWSTVLKNLQDNNTSYAEVTVDNKPAIKITEAKGVFPLATPAYEQKSYGTVINLESGGTWVSLFIYRYEMDGGYYKELPPTLEDIALFDQILSTFKFLD